MSLVISYIDYCNSTLAGIPASTPFQQLQNAAAQRVLGHNRRSTLLLCYNNWLPVKYQIMFKVAVRHNIHSIFHHHCKYTVASWTLLRLHRRLSTTSPAVLDGQICCRSMYTQFNNQTSQFIGQTYGTSTTNSDIPTLRLLDSHSAFGIGF